MNGSQSKDILPLTGVRFFAVIMIFLFHYAYRISFGGEILTGILNQLYLGVQVFFVLSGFVICYKYFEGTESRREIFLTYYLRRFAKIYPSFFLITTLTLALWYFKDGGDASFWKIYFLNITFLKGFSANYYLSGVGPTWSLTVEEVFYLLSPFIFLFIKRKKILFGQVFLWWAIGGLLILLFNVFPFDGFFENAQFVYFVTFFGRCFEFYLGIWLALQVMGYKYGRLKLPSFAFPLYTTAGLLGMASFIICTYKVSLIYNTNAPQVFAGIFLSNILFPISVVFFFYGLIKEVSLIQRLLSTALFQLLGKSSYAFFLIHTGAIAIGIEKYVSSNVIILFIALQTISILLYKFFETPVNLWIRRKGKLFIKPPHKTGKLA